MSSPLHRCLGILMPSKQRVQKAGISSLLQGVVITSVYTSALVTLSFHVTPIIFGKFCYLNSTSVLIIQASNLLHLLHVVCQPHFIWNKFSAHNISIFKKMLPSWQLTVIIVASKQARHTGSHCSNVFIFTFISSHSHTYTHLLCFVLIHNGTSYVRSYSLQL